MVSNVYLVFEVISPALEPMNVSSRRRVVGKGIIKRRANEDFANPARPGPRRIYDFKRS